MKQLFQILTAGALIVAVGCQHPDDAISGGGKGGNNTLSVTPEHADSLISTCKVYIKYGVLDAPANNLYDDSASPVMMNGVPKAIFHNLIRGNYYLYAQGTHVGYTPPGLKGGVPVTINSTADSLQVFLPTYSF